MSKLTDQLATIGIHNPRELVDMGHPFICREPRKWVVTHKSMLRGGEPGQSDRRVCFWERIDQFWRDAVSMCFTHCEEWYPKLEMVKGPWPNTYVPLVDLEAAMLKLKEKKCSQK